MSNNEPMVDLVLRGCLRGSSVCAGELWLAVWWLGGIAEEA